MTSQHFTYCTFRTDGHWLGTPIEDVKEVNRHAATTRIPHAPLEVAGYVNVRGHIYLALDLARLLGLHAAATRDQHLILFKSSVGPSFGIVVDEIGDIATVDERRIDDFTSTASQFAAGGTIQRTDLIAKVCRCPAELLIVLDPRKFLTIVEQALSTIE